MADIEVPGFVLTAILKPVARILKIKYVPKNNNKLLLKKIFEKIASRAKKLDTGTFQKIIEHLTDIIAPFSSIASMFATLFQPLMKLIPPEYMVIIIAVLLLAFLLFFFIYPAAFLGVFVAYKAETLIKVPFTDKSKRIINNIYPLTFRDQFIVKKVETRKITTTMLKFLELPLETQHDYLYENDIPAAYRLIASQIYRFLPEEKRNVETIIYLAENPPLGISGFMLDALKNALTSLTTKITLTATFYSGMRRVFPPLINRMVNAFKGLLIKTQDSTYLSNLAQEIQEHPLQAIFTFIVPMIRAGGATVNPEAWKPEPNV